VRLVKVGITFDLKSDQPLGMDVPDDHQEEYDSPATVEAVAEAIRAMGHEVVLLGDGPEMLRRVLAVPPDFVFNFAEGHGISPSREARVPAVLEMLGIPYTGSGPLALAATLDKDVARRLVQSHGGQVPRGQVYAPDADLAAVRALPHLPYTAIVKPAWEGSSKGIRGKCVVDTPAELAYALEARRDQRQPLLVEEFIVGEELTVGVVGNSPPTVIGILRVVPRKRDDRFVYSLEVKRDWEDKVRFEAPPRLPAAQLRAVEEAALLAFRALGCQDIARIDFRLRDGVPYFLEANPLPGMNPETSDLVILAKKMWWTHAGLVQAVLTAAMRRVRME
jgi:D-alanine-D-alanine ligase